MVLGLALCAWPGGLRAASDDETAAIRALLATLAESRQGHVRFSEQLESPLLKAPLQSTGELFFSAPDRLERRTLTPARADLILEGDIVTIISGRRRRSFPLSEYPPLRPLLYGLRATLVGDYATLADNFQLALQADGGHWTLTLRPPAAATAPLFTHILISGDAGTVSSVTLERQSGERTVTRLSEIPAP